MHRGRLVVGALAASCLIAACTEPVEHGRPVAIGRTDFLGADLYYDVQAAPGLGGRAFEGLRFTDGWTRPGDSGIWAVGHSSKMEVTASANARHLWIECHSDHLSDKPQVVTVVADGEPAGEFQPDSGHFGWFSVEIGKGGDRRVRHIELRFRQARTPEQAAGSNDSRPLALMVRRVALTRNSRPPKSGDWSAPVERKDGRVRVHRAGWLYLNLHADDPVAEFEVKLRRGALDTAPTGLQLVDPTSGVTLAGERVEGSSWTEKLVTLPVGGRTGDLVLVMRTGNGGGVINGVWSTAAPDDARSEPPRATEAEAPEVRPDIVVFLLDAARADHVGSTYGYARDTAPVIDRLAGQSFVFKRVFAQAPYTSCSVPTMFTGLGWGVHGVVANDDALPEGEQTLAEILASAGYETIGFTASPNDSVRNGMDQGFEEFYDLWDGVDWSTAINPMYLASKLEKRLARGLPGKPLFLMLHVSPPHSPYTPPSEYRIWSDPEYTGPCDGSDGYMNQIRGHRNLVSDADLEQLISLYDANLRYSDDAVGRILSALSAAGRLDRAIVVVTADHGEAFFEHGHLDHNTTIYDEMLHVPLILRLPPSIRARPADLSRFISLEDLTPTLLGLVGLPPPERATGVNFFSGPERTGIIQRTANGPNIRGYRTDRWKMMVDRNGRIAKLYDLVSDPAERTNVILEHPVLVSWLANSWDRAEASLPEKLETREATTTEQEKVLLRRLGYVE